MAHKSTLYTRTGDLGTTSLIGGERVAKNNIRVNAYGSIDELNSFLGLLLATTPDNLTVDDRNSILWVQNVLFDLGAYLATESNDLMTEAPGLGQETISRLETEIDRLDAETPPLKHFVLPGGTQQSAVASVCRTVCRRAERDIITLKDSKFVDSNVLRFINRLSDYLFILSRNINHRARVEETVWKTTINN